MTARTLPQTLLAAKAVQEGRLSQQMAAIAYGVNIATIRRQLRRLGVSDLRKKAR